MEPYNVIMLILVLTAIIVTFIIGFIRNNNIPKFNNEVTSFSKLSEARLKQIYNACKSWYSVSKVWCSMHHSLNVISISASIITVYIASTPNYNGSDVIFYSVITFVCSSAGLILKCDTKSVQIRTSYNTMCKKLAMFEMKRCTDKELVKQFYKCEKEITKFYI